MSIAFQGASSNKVVKGAFATLVNTQRTTTNAAYTDATGLSVTISGLTASKTYHVTACACCAMVNAAAGSNGFASIAIDGVLQGEIKFPDTGGGNKLGTTLSGGATFTGATSVIVKIQIKSDGGGACGVGSSDTTSSIWAMAAEQ